METTMMALFEDSEDREELEEMQQRIIEQEHSQMPKTCSKCGGKMKFATQTMIAKPVMGDLLTYKCQSCGDAVEKFFEFPEEYTKYFTLPSKAS
jgi:ribosomal protein L44E